MRLSGQLLAPPTHLHATAAAALREELRVEFQGEDATFGSQHARDLFFLTILLHFPFHVCFIRDAFHKEQFCHILGTHILLLTSDICRIS